jgi:hypothetical protein
LAQLARPDMGWARGRNLLNFVASQLAFSGLRNHYLSAGIITACFADVSAILNLHVVFIISVRVWNGMAQLAAAHYLSL